MTVFQECLTGSHASKCRILTQNARLIHRQQLQQTQKQQAAHVDPLRAAQAVTEMATQPNDDSAESHDAISEITHVAPPTKQI